MQLKFSTSYAIRIVLYLAMSEQTVLLDELAETLKIDECYVIKFSKRLEDAGIVRIDDNIQYGFSLAKNPKQIIMFDIINIMESSTKINLCLEEEKYCSRFEVENCPVRKFYCELQNNIENSLKSKTIYDLLNT